MRFGPYIGGPIRIGSNENPYGPGPAALQAVAATATGANRYPGPAVQALINVIAEKFGVPADHVLLSGGSGDILRAVVEGVHEQDEGARRRLAELRVADADGGGESATRSRPCR